MTHFIELFSALDGAPTLINIDEIAQVWRSRDNPDHTVINFKDGKYGTVIDSYQKIKELIIKYTENANAD